jgi:hypothetical protein
MKIKIIQSFSILRRKKQEKGAALVTVILLMLLILSVAGAILIVTSLSNSSTTDAVAEKQAFEAAEAGMQQVLNVLRGNGAGEGISFKEAAVRTTSNKADDWSPQPRLSKWLNYTYPASQPDRVPLTGSYAPYTGLAFSVEIVAPDAVPTVIPTPNPTWIDGPVVKPASGIKPTQPAWHPWHCSHCSWDYTHCSLYNPPTNGTLRADGTGCRHKHCIPPAGWGGADDGYQRLLVKVTGYGPRGARKELELLVKRVIFDYEPEPLIYLQGSQVGGDIGFALSGTPEVKFDCGSKMNAFVLTNSSDMTVIENVINQPDKVTIDGKGDHYEVFASDQRPKFLASADEARATMSDLEADAKVRGRWFNSYPTNNTGTDTVPEFTFVRGDAQLTSNGAGILVVTGTLTLNSNFSYKGLILILEGGNLNITGGDSKIEGSIAIAKYNSMGNFLAPSINISGGKIEFKANAEKVEEAFKTVNMRVLAVREN